MKNLFKLGFLALAMTLTLSACDLFSSKRNSSKTDSNKLDSSTIDSNKIDTNLVDSTKIKADSTTQIK